MAELPPYLVESKDGSLLSVFVQPRAAKDEVVGFQGDALKVKVRAPADQGKANRAVCELIAEMVGVPRRDVVVVSGGASRHKRIGVQASPAAVMRAVELVLSSRAPRGASRGELRRDLP
jgi:uncharacterized protein